ncbi:MAG: ABC transporter substrate-binding protein [Clostridia bacterium]|nr:ABC transporter substrate-binding protein [Clostridia bacterium]
MTKFVKAACFIMASLFLTIFTACCGAANNIPTSPGKTDSSSVLEASCRQDISGKGNLWAAKKLTLGYSQGYGAWSWGHALYMSIQEAAKDWNVNLEFYDAQGKQDLQIKQLRKFIAANVDVIGLYPCTTRGYEDILREMKAANIPVIIIDRKIDTVDDSLYSGFIASDFHGQGQKAAEWLMDFVVENGRTDEVIKIVELQGTIGSIPSEERSKGFRQGIQENSKLKIIDSAEGVFSRMKGQEIMEKFLKKRKKIHALYASNDFMALGALEAIEKAGLKPGKDIIIIGVDAEKEALEAIASGKMNCSIEYTPLLGPMLMESCIKITNGEVLDKKIYPIEKIIDRKNVQEELMKHTRYNY